MLPNMHCTCVFQRQTVHSLHKRGRKDSEKENDVSPQNAGKPIFNLSRLCFQFPRQLLATFQSPVAHAPHLLEIPIQHLQFELKVSSSDTQSHPQESPYLQSRGPVPRVRTGVAGTLRPSKLEALLGSERVGLDRDGRPTLGPRLETALTSRPSCQPRLRIPLLVSGKEEKVLLYLVGLATELRRLFRSP